MEYERRTSIAVLVAICVTILSEVPALHQAVELVFVALFVFALWLVIRATAAEDGTPQLKQLSARVWLACFILGVAVFVTGPSESVGVLVLRVLGAIALADALALWSRSRKYVAASTGERPSQ